MRAPIALVDYGAGNLRSVEFALERLGVAYRRADRPEGLRGAGGIVLPGVGAAASAMRALAERELDAALREAELPLLGICLGMQLLTERSDEGWRAPGEDGAPEGAGEEREPEGAGENEPVECLGLLPGATRRLRGQVTLPHVGWNETTLTDDPLFEGLGERAWFYYLHAHRVDVSDDRVAARAEHGEPFPAALRAGRVAGVQFHPEKSGPDGLRVLANFCRERS